MLAKIFKLIGVAVLVFSFSSSFVFASEVTGTIGTVSTASSNPPAAPSGLSASQVSGEMKVSLSWSAVDGATSYKIYQSGANSGWESATAVATGVTAISYTSGSLSSETYYYRVKAVSSNGDSDFSTTVTVSVNTTGGTQTSSSGGGGGGGGGGSYTPVTTTTTSKLSIEAQKVDANKDDKIDVLDFNSLMVNWGGASAGNVADFNKDGKVDIFDFNTLMVNWAV
ncbi:MAG: hypothetical protein A2390_03210 [Candidatus Liptonbacteria bacterium RIFOXYB1_FULL_36_10]|uniref:Fibronectin type-III domain-containing protein n=1 Tax=Candidatus Liptonbacteria bacterium RIFOXYB1_FULL_36_10 TaxID=1798654 RepID=A0A1G2CPW8_9BACT|nr:MAG: hypothetical protein A2390_03210 [Candidatus Liptonbacteria bacterium RIFOXYB1_FULL_36_10]